MAVIEYNKGIAAAIVFVVGLIVYFKSIGLPTSTVVSMDKSDKSHKTILKDTSPLPHGYKRMTTKTAKTWLTDRQLQPIPDDLDFNIIFKEEVKTFKFNGQEVKMFTRIASPTGKPKGDLLLLHGAAFSSSNWNTADLNTIKTMAALGYRTLAVDLPGRGQTISPVITPQKDFLTKVISVTGLKAPVIVSPSYSGGFSVPYVVDATPEICSGYVPVAAVGHTSPDVSKTNIPVMIIYGENDTGAKTSTKYFSGFPNNEIFMLNDAPHPAYLKQPKAFNFLLYNFVLSVKNQ